MQKFKNPHLPDAELLRAYIELCREALENPAPDFDSGIYYQQVRSVRDVLLDLEKHKACHPELTRQPIDDALRYAFCRTVIIGLTLARPLKTSRAS